MDKKQIDEKHLSTNCLINSKHLKQAFDSFRELLTNNVSAELLAQCDELETNYKYMLMYTVEGAQDPERDRIYMRLVRLMHELNDNINVYLNQKCTSLFPYTHTNTSRSFALIIKELNQYSSEVDLQSIIVSDSTSNTGITETDVHIDLQEELFTRILNLTNPTDDELTLLNQFFSSNLLYIHDQALMISALFFNLLKQFNEKLMLFLCNLCELKKTELKQRALVSLILCLYRYDTRLYLYPQLIHRLEALKEVSGITSHLETIIMQLISTRETEKITKILHDEIIPEVIKINPQLMKRLNIDDLLKEGTAEDINPDWSEGLAKDSKLSKKIEELGELQMAGADVFMSTFAQLKTYPFFIKAQNWFVPFYITKKEIKDMVSGKFEQAVKGIAQSTFLCNSDKYSFCFSIQHLSNIQQNVITDQLSEQLKEMEDSEKDELLLQKDVHADKLSNQYIHDLYRFFKVHPHRYLVQDLFMEKFDFYNKTFMNGVLGTDSLKKMARFYFEKQFYNDALELLLLIHPQDASNVECIQKIAYCYQQLKDYEQALKYYLQADITQSQSYWNLRKIALCYRNLGQTENALNYYREAEKVNPDDLRNQISIGHCLLELKQYANALAVFFKIEYLGTPTSKVWRPITWCCFVSGKLEQAKKYSKQILQDHPSAHDYINRGHIEWCLNNRKEAIMNYKQALKTNKINIDSLVSTMKDDKEWLMTYGVNADDIPIMIDQLMYELTN